MPDIYLLGSGIRGTLQMTLETVQALDRCRTVFVLHPDTMVLDFVREHCADVRDMSELYQGRQVRQDVYTAISHEVIAAAKAGGPVAFLVHGHPLFLVSATEYTIELARHSDLSVAVLPGVSSFDTLLCDLGIDYGYGVQIFDSTSMCENNWKPNPAVPLLVFQLPTTYNREVVRDRPTGEVLKPLVDYLVPIYGPEHEVKVIHSGAFILETTEIIDFALGDLATDKLDLTRRPTLYVPPVD
jgi:siroheme synthase